MKKHTAILLFLLLLSCADIAQTIPTCNKIFYDTGIVSGGVNITSLNDSIYFTIYTQDTSTSFQYVDFIKTSSDGTELKRLKIKIPGYSYLTGFTGSLKITSDGYLICVGNSGPVTGGVASGTFFKLDRNTLDTLYVKYYNDSNSTSDFFGLSELSDGNYLFAGREGEVSSQGFNSGWMVKTDTGGNQLWQKSLTYDIYNSAVYTSSFLGGYYQWWASGNDATASNNAAAVIFIDKYNNNGNLQWRDTFGVVGNDNVSGPFIASHDGGGLIFINKLDTLDPSIGLINIPSILYKFDSNGSIQWHRYFAANFIGAAGMIETGSGNIVICGSGYGKLNNADTIGYDGGSILKLDKNGYTIFYQVYKYDSTAPDGEGLGDITEMSDGGYACIGDAFENIGGTNYQKAWLLKVDSNGCLNGNCPTIYTGIKTIPDLVNFFVFPNPASSRYTVALAGPNDIDLYHDLTFSLYDLTGRLVHTQTLTQQTTILQRGDLSDGLYVWNISDGNQNLTSGKIAFR